MTTSSTSSIEFLAMLRGNVDAWYADDIDFATFTACQRDTWEAIRNAGRQIEEEVLRTLRGQLPTVPASVTSRLRQRRYRAQIPALGTHDRVVLELADHDGPNHDSRNDKDIT